MSEDIEIIVLGVSESVVKAIAARRSQAVAKILPAKGAWSMMAHLAALHQLRPDVVHCNLCTPWACATGLTAALTLPHVRAIRVDQLPLRTTDALTLWRTRDFYLCGLTLMLQWVKRVQGGSKTFMLWVEVVFYL